ncbi:MAG: hypothetical protein ABH950_07520 [Candidatus Altiarchaeota archaeon]
MPATVFENPDQIPSDQRIIKAEYGMHFIPPQEGKILVEGDELYVKRLIQNFNLPFSQDKFVVVDNMIDYQVEGEKKYLLNVANPLIDKGIIDLEKNDSNYFANTSFPPNYFYNRERIKSIVEALDSNEITLVIESPPVWTTIDHILMNAKSNQCMVYLPNFEYLDYNGRHHTTLYFQDLRDCALMDIAILGYYSNTYESICAESEFEALAVSLVMSNYNLLPFNQTCESGAAFIPDLNKIRPPGYRFTSDDVIYIAIIFLSSYIFIRWERIIG